MGTNISHPELIEKLNTKTLIIEGLVTIIAVVAFVLSWKITGIFLLVLGVSYFFLNSKQEVYEPTGSIVKKHSYYFDRDNTVQLAKIVKGNISEDTEAYKLVNSGSARMDVVASEDMEFFAAQLFRFVPHTYEPETELIIYTGPKAKEMSQYLERCKKA